MERTGFLAHVEANSRIVCPNPACKAEFDGDQRIELMSTGRWLQPHQEWPPNGRVKGEALVSATMGFVIHAFMAPFAKFHAIPRDYASALARTSVVYGTSVSVRLDLGGRRLITKKKDHEE